MVSNTKESNRADFLLRMPSKMKERLVRAADEDGTTIRDLVLYAIEQMLNARDAEVAADKRRAALEQHLELKFDEIVVLLAGGDIAGLSADKLTDQHDLAEAAIQRWRDHTATYYHAEPRTPIEHLCKAYDDIEAELQRVPTVIRTFKDDDEALLEFQ